MAQVVECLPNKCEPLRSNSNTAKKVLNYANIVIMSDYYFLILSSGC
jgi:hypothetical protein